MKNLVGILIVVFIFFMGCSDDELAKKTGTNTTPDPDPHGSRTASLPTIYLAGVANNNGKPVATYWKDSVAVNLESTYGDASTYSSAAFSIAVSGTDVYVAGVTHTSKGNIATYWKNGQAFHLSPNKHAQADDIAVVGDDIYVVGIMSAGNGYSYGVIWKNGVESTITEDETYSQLTSIAISGEDIYVAGYIGTEGTPGYAAYWKNGEVTLLTDGTSFACAKSIRVYNEDVYVTCPDVQMAKYWKNGNEMSGTSEYSTVSSIAIFNNDLYVAGMIGGSSAAEGKVSYWKNGELQNSSSLIQRAELGAIALLNDTVFVSGSIINVNEASSVSSKAICWKNGIAITLGKGDFDSTNIFYASSMVVAR
jgi:hypothetical protein